jgi:hypothetical protein
MIYHFVVGDMAAQPLQEAIQLEPSLQGEVIVLKDILHVGPLKKEAGSGFSALRTAFWQEVMGADKQVEVDDMERLLEVSKQMFQNPDVQAWLWMAPWPADVMAYHWMLPYLGKHMGRFYLVNIAGLPFLDENGKVFFPKNISDIQPKELVKARRLARQVTPAEYEIDGEEWNKMEQENAPIRTHEGGKKIAARGETIMTISSPASAHNSFRRHTRWSTRPLASTTFLRAIPTWATACAIWPPVANCCCRAMPPKH